MTYRMRMCLFSLSILLLENSYAMGLLEGYQLMLSHDPNLSAARHERAAGGYEVGLGRAGLLPQVSATATRTRVTGYVQQQQAIGISNSQYVYGQVRTYQRYPSWSGSVNLKQPIFNIGSFYNYLQGIDKSSYSDAVYDAKLNDITVKYMQAYLSLLLADENCKLTEKQLEALNERLQLSIRSFKGGETSITDIDDAQAKFDIAKAQMVEFKNQLAVARLKLSNLTGTSAVNVEHILSDFPVEKPVQLTLDQWFEVSLKNNPQILAARKNADISKRELQKTKAANAPTLDLIASAEKSNTIPSSSLEQQRSSYRTIGVQLNVPIFSGGYNLSAINQSLEKYEMAQSTYDATVSSVNEELSFQFLNITTGIEKIMALQGAVASGERAVYSNKKGIVAGVRANIDVLNAEQQLFQSRRDLNQARFVYLLSWISFKSAGGVLGVEDIANLDRYFVKSQKVK